VYDGTGCSQGFFQEGREGGTRKLVYGMKLKLLKANIIDSLIVFMIENVLKIILILLLILG
jgi:hypothetical protein